MFNLYCKDAGVKNIKYKNIVIILLHGFLSTDVWKKSQFFYKLVKKLKIRCIQIDLLGFGKSPKPNNIEYTLEDHVNSLEYTLINTILKTVEYPQLLYGIGYSLGATLLLKLNERKTIPIVKNVLISPLMNISHNEKFNSISKFINSKNFNLLYDTGKMLLGVTTQIPQISLIPNVFKTYINEVIINEAHVVKKTFANIINNQNINYDQIFDNIARPTLWIYSKNDEFISFENVIKKYDHYKHFLQYYLLESSHNLDKNNCDEILEVITWYFNLK